MSNYFIAHITIEAKTPLKVGSNASDVLQDSPIQKDFNGLPMILGTSITGVLRRAFKGKVKEVFGEENGSKIIISNALILDEEGRVYEKLLLDKSNFLNFFNSLPIRNHTAMNDKGVVKEHSKFDEEVLYAGSRFKFSIALQDDEKSFKEILDLLSANSFRLGGGSTKGLGKVKVLEIQTQKFIDDNYEEYVNSLNFKLKDTYASKAGNNQEYTKYLLKIRPDDFFIFGSGFGDEDADNTAVYEQHIDYGKKRLSEKKILVPASSIKGAISHRVAFHYNKLIGATIESGNAKVGEENEAVIALFGHKKEIIDHEEAGQKGKVLFSDCFQDNREEVKTFDHVSIDCFTGGAIEGALFQEKTIAQKDMYEIEILLHKSTEDKKIIQAFEQTLEDITTGMLSLGGMTTKGHGIFSGEVFRDNKKLELKNE